MKCRSAVSPPVNVFQRSNDRAGAADDEEGFGNQENENGVYPEE